MFPLSINILLSTLFSGNLGLYLFLDVRDLLPLQLLFAGTIIYLKQKLFLITFYNNYGTVRMFNIIDIQYKFLYISSPILTSSTQHYLRIIMLIIKIAS